MIAYILPYFPERFVWLFSKKYIAGKELKDALATIDELKAVNCISTVDVLGEAVETADEAKLYLNKYLETITAISEKTPETSFSVKPTMFGLQWDREFCYHNLRKIVSLAASGNSFVRIDMENSGCTDAELELFGKLYREFPAHVGIVLQSYLRRTLEDIEKLAVISDSKYPVNIRLCKGIYIEPRKIAYKNKNEIRENFIRCLQKMLSYGMYPALATHDKILVYRSLEVLEKYVVKRERYEFQMLLGVTPRLRKELTDAQHPMRVYVPFGDMWFRYATRRLQENPNMVWDIISGIFIRK